MFGNSKRKDSLLVLEHEAFNSLIGVGTHVKGDISTEVSLRIDGSVQGNLNSKGDDSISVVIGATGEVNGNIQAHRVVIAGKVTGNIMAAERVELRSNSQVHGDISYQSIALEHGAIMQGQLRQLDRPGQPLILSAPHQNPNQQAIE
jgi:cytoskeletal protein CcmA (bactofilin family)